ncbi:MAG: glycoside hydrolase family 97 N-terminal domain-containing protein [Parabacteroides sp.]
MVNKPLRIFFLLSFLLLGLNFSNATKANNHDVLSPNKKLVMHIQQQTNGGLTYSFTANRTLLIDKSQMGFKLESKEIVPGLGWIIKHISKKVIRSVWKPVWGKRAVVPDRYNEPTIEMERSSAALNKKNQATAPNKIDLIARAYDDEIAFQYKIPKDNKGEANVLEEETNYNFAGDYTAWFYNGENRNIGSEKLTATDTIRRLVMTIKAGKNHYMAVHEANLLTGAPLVLQSKKGEQLCDRANYLTNREAIKISSKTVNNKESLHLKLASGGGACLKFTKTKM